MAKSIFASTSMLTAITTAVNIREMTYETVDGLVSGDTQLLQILSEMNQVPFQGPEKFSPDTTAIYTPFETQFAQTSPAEAPFYETFAQQSTAERQCTISMLRNWNTTDDFHQVRLSQDEKFTDVNFPTDDAIVWEDFDESFDTNVEWMRISDLAYTSQKFWGDGGTQSISVADIRQGQLGNCWMMAAISALAEHPERVDKIMVSNEFEPAGIYAMNFYSLGVPFTQIVDDYIPVIPGTNQPKFARVGEDGSVWGQIVEKMFAKWYGNYRHLQGGLNWEAVSALNGSPFEVKGSENSADQIWEFITEHDNDRDIITAASRPPGFDDDFDYQGVSCCHAYTVISSHVVHRNNHSEHVRVLKVRNPWGAELYQGPWSDNWDGWTEEDRTQLPGVQANDGLFYIDIDSYMENFANTAVNQDTHDWHLGYFMMKDDPKTIITNTDCGQGVMCTKHQIRVKNTGPAQDIYVGAHVWRWRHYTYTQQCAQRHNNGSTGEPSHAFYEEGGSQMRHFDSYHADMWLPMYTFPADSEKVFTVVFNWDAPADERKRDWSLTAWGTDHELVVEYIGDVGTDHPLLHDDEMRATPEYIPYPGGPEPDETDDGENDQTCWDNDADGSLFDKDGSPYNCNWYNSNPGDCGKYNSIDFFSEIMCCGCEAGGCSCDPNDPTCDCKLPEPLDPDQQEQICWDNDENGTLFDVDGSPYNCGWYNQHPTDCGNYNDDDFQSELMCCGCQGGCACDPSDDSCTCEDEADAMQDSGPQFEACDANNDIKIDLNEIQDCYIGICDEKCEGELANNDCTQCYEHPIYQLLTLYDVTHTDGVICPEEFNVLYNDALKNEIEWLEIDHAKKEFFECDKNHNDLLDDQELHECWLNLCAKACTGGDAECQCQDHDTSLLLYIYDSSEPLDQVCPDEFITLYTDAVNNSVPWPVISNELFTACDSNTDQFIDNMEIEECFDLICDQKCELDNESVETCDCRSEANIYELIELYSKDDDNQVCPDTFKSMYSDALKDQISWSESEPYRAQFFDCDKDHDDFLNDQEVQECWIEFCVDECESNASDECFCENRDTTSLMQIYDVDEPSDLICPSEFFKLYDQTISQTVPWPEEQGDEAEEEDDEEDESDNNNEDEEIDEESDGNDESEEDEGADDESDEQEENDDQESNDDQEDGNDEKIDGNFVQTQGDFDMWVRDQQVSDSDYYCKFEIKNIWHNGYFLWAGHNCDIYDLTLKVLVPKDAWLNRRTWTSQDANLLQETCDADSDQCQLEFFITPSNPSVGVGFDSNGPAVNFEFETESWTDCVDRI